MPLLLPDDNENKATAHTALVRDRLQLCPKLDAWALFHHPSTPTFHSVDNHIVLLGDAAHSMCPHYGQGGSMAFEDAFVLAGLLAECRVPADFHRALRAYDCVRVPRANEIVRRSFERAGRLSLGHMGDVLEGDLPRMARDWDYTPDWIWHEDLDAHLARALEEFREGG